MTGTTTGGKWLPDEIWEMVAPLIPPPRKRRSDGRGRPRLDDRKVLTGIIFVLRTGIPWRHMPPELGCGSGMTCLRRLRDWHRRGVFQKLYEVLLAKLHSADRIDWSRVIVDSAKTKAPSGGDKTGPNPTDRRKLGSKVHVLVDAHGIPLAISLTGANRHDVTQVLPLTDGISPVRGKKKDRQENVPNFFKVIGVTIRNSIVKLFELVASCRFSQNDTPIMVLDWAPLVGWSKELSPGSRASVK